MAVTHHKSSTTIRGVTYNYGDAFVCYASYGGATTSEGSGSALDLTKGTTYYYMGYATGDSNNITHPYAVSATSGGAIRGWYKENVFPYATYTITYNANGGNGAPSAQTKTHGTSLTLSSTKPTRAGYTFKGWALSRTEANNGTWYYQAGGTCGKNENLTLYATWEEHKLTINYYSNYATNAYFDAENAVGADKNVKVFTGEIYYDNDYSSYGLANYSNANGSIYMTRTGYTGTGNWGTITGGGILVNENTGFKTGRLLAEELGRDLSIGSGSINLYAQWKINTYTINYDANGGYGDMSSQSVKWQEKFAFTNNVFKRDGYKFIGWHLYRNDDKKWYAVNQGWLTDSEISSGGYEKRLYENQTELTFDMSWIKGKEDSINQYTMYAVWEISGVVYIDNGTTFEPYLAYIDNGEDWDLYLMYIDNGTSWDIIS